MRLALFCLLLFTFTTARAQHHVNLTWSGSAGAASYNVYRASGTCTGTPSFLQLANTIITNSYTDNAVVAGSQYCYEATAVNPSGESGPSNLAGALVPSGGLPDLGENCTNGCGLPITGNHILPTTVTVTLFDTASGCRPDLPAQQQVSGYTNLPLTIDPTKMCFNWSTDVPANGCVVLGALANNSDRIQCDVTGSTYNIGVNHQVIVQHLIPASHNGNAGGSITAYVTSNINATSTDPQNRYSVGQNTWPGPQCYAGSTNCYLNFFPPNPTAAMPLQWEITPAGVVTATRGFPAEIPLYILWKGANATSVTGLGPCTSAQLNYMGHVYAANQWAAPNSGQWYVCNGTNWTSLGGGLPSFVATSTTITQGANTYTCGANANGGHDPTTRAPTATCTGGAGDSHTALTPYYAGAWSNGGSSTDYRPIHYSSGLGKYWMDMNAAAPPANAQPTSVLEYYPAANGLLGDVTVNMTLTMYTDANLTTVAGGTAPLNFTYTIHVADNVPVTQVDPSTYPVDPNMPAYMSNVSQKAVTMCSEAGSAYSMDYFNLNISYWMWLTMSAGDWGPFNTGQYDQSRTFMESGDFFLAKMDGSAWPDWAATIGYGNSYNLMEVTPSTDPNGNTWLATVPGGQSGSTPPNWASIPSPRADVLLTDGGQKWRNVGKRSYWNRCNQNSGVPFWNQVIQQGSAQWAQFTGAAEKNRQRTGDTITKGTTPITGFYSKVENTQIGSDFGAGAFSQFSASAGRGPAYQVMAWATYWKTQCDAGTCANFTGNDEYKRQVFWQINATINYWDIHENSNDIDPDPTKTYWPTFDPLHFGVGAEALIEWYIRDKELDPSNTLGLLDPRIIPALKQMGDFAYKNWYNQCRVQGEGTDNWSMSYNPMDVQTCAILEPYYTELTGPIQALYDFLGRYAGNGTIPGTTVTYFQAADQIRMHMYDGRLCNNPQGKWYCSQYSIPWGGGSGVPKTFGQTTKWTMGNSYQYRTGAWTPFEDDLSPQHNPCWTGGSTPCGSPTPYPDTTAPYMAQILPSGGQDDPNCENHSTGQACSPVQNVTSTTAQVQFNVYEQTTSAWVNYGKTNTCHDGQVNTETGGYPQLKNSNNQRYLHNFTLTNLLPNTQYWVQMCAVDGAGNQACNSCATIPGNFRGGNINFTTGVQTVLTVVTTTLPDGIINVGYSQTLQAAGGTPPYTWSITTGALPTGLTLNASSGLISGSPTAGGTFNFTVRVTDSLSNHADQPLSIRISDLSISTTSIPNVIANTPFSFQLQASGGTPPYSWTELGRMPNGLSLATDGTISGTATTCGVFPVAWTVTDSGGLKAAKPLSITVVNCTFTLQITTTNLPGGTQGQPYTTTLAGTGGTGSGYTWSIISGALPDGLTLHASTGVIDGTPTVPNTFNFTVQLKDSGNNTASAPLSIAVASSLLVITTGSLPGGSVGNPYTTSVLATGGVLPYQWCVQEASGQCDNGSNGALPAGLTLATVSNNGVISGTPTATGTSNFVIQVTDSFNPPSQTTKPMSITISGTAPQFGVTFTGSTTVTGNTKIQ